jgi:hypothetical protein
MPHKRKAPKLQVRIKTHKDQYPVRPVVNNINAPSYKIAQFLNNKLLEILQLPYTCNVLNSTQLAHDITKLKLDEYHRCITLDIKDFFTNIPIKETIKIPKHLLEHNNITEEIILQYTDILYIILKHSYFSYDNKYYTCSKGVAMGSPISNTIAEIFLQHHEELFIKH